MKAKLLRVFWAPGGEKPTALESATWYVMYLRWVMVLACLLVVVTR